MSFGNIGHHLIVAIIDHIPNGWVMWKMGTFNDPCQGSLITGNPGETRDVYFNQSNQSIGQPCLLLINSWWLWVPNDFFRSLGPLYIPTSERGRVIHRSKFTMISSYFMAIDWICFNLFGQTRWICSHSKWSWLLRPTWGSCWLLCPACCWQIYSITCKFVQRSSSSQNWRWLKTCI